MESGKIHYMQTPIKEGYMKIWKLLKKYEEMTNPDESYDEKYVAIEILEKTINELNMIAVTSLTDTKNKILILAITHLYLGILHSKMNETIEAEAQFMTCINLLKNRALEPEVILPSINSLNELGKLYTKLKKYKMAKISLEEAEKLYIYFTESIRLDPINMCISIGIKDIEGELSAKDFLKKLHVMTLDYLIQLYDALDDQHNSMEYRHRKLTKQLNLDRMMHDLDYIDWISTAAIISQYYQKQDNFPQARYHLAAASYILRKCRDTLDAKEAGESNIISEYEIYHHISADVARYWMTYGLALMGASHGIKMAVITQKDQSDSKMKSAKSAVDLRFDNIEPAKLEAIISQITDQPLSDSEACRTMYLNIVKWSDQAIKYYNSDDYISDHVNIELDISEACRYLVIFKVDVDTEKMLKERIDILKDLVEKLNPQYYRTLCQKIWFQLGNMYTHVLEMIERSRSSKKKSTTRMIKMTNRLVWRNIGHFRSYLDFMEFTESNSTTDSLQVVDLYKLSYASFRIGELYGYIKTSNLRIEISNTQHRLEAYQFLLSCCNQYISIYSEKEMEAWIQKSKELVDTLPLTLHRLRQRLRYQ